jgi:hypothetical protein
MALKMTIDLCRIDDPGFLFAFPHNTYKAPYIFTRLEINSAKNDTLFYVAPSEGLRKCTTNIALNCQLW